MGVLQPGRVFGAFRIVRQLGAGGMGVVYEAEHLRLPLRRALKVFSTESVHVALLRKRFLAEGRILSSLQHPRIVRVYDMTVDEATGLAYFEMDLVCSPSGEPQTLAQAHERGVDEDKIKAWFEDVCEGLAYIHSKGVIHRDISADNILIGSDGHAVISDFGIAKIVDEEYRRRIDVTVTMMTPNGVEFRMGKERYMSPELKAKNGKASFASDAWALGVTLFWMLSGSWYDVGTRLEDALAIFDHDWAFVIAKLCGRNPSERLPEGGIREVPRLLKRRDSACQSWFWRAIFTPWILWGGMIVLASLCVMFLLPAFDVVKDVERGDLERRQELVGRFSQFAISNNCIGKSSIRIEGDEYRLTFDGQVQSIVESEILAGCKKFNACSGRCIVMNPMTGAIIAMTTNVLDFAYQPGNVIMTFIAAKAIDMNNRKLNTQYNTSRNDSNYSFCALPTDGGSRWPDRMSIGDALIRSSNIVFAKLGNDMGPECVYNCLKDFGFGSVTGVELPNELSCALIPWEEWSSRMWTRVAVGQIIQCTLLQLTSAYQSIFLLGRRVRPHVIDRIFSSDGKLLLANEMDFVGQPVGYKAASAISIMLGRVVESGGTAPAANIGKGCWIAGKTGTSLLQGNYAATFCGIVSKNHKRFLISVELDINKNAEQHRAGDTSGAVFKAIAEKLLDGWES